MSSRKHREAEILRRSASASTAATLLVVAFVLALVPGISGWVRAISQENTGGGQTAAEAAPGQPVLQAQSWVLVDADTGLYLAGKNPNKRLPIASTTNVMTALVVLEEGVDLSEKVVIPEQAERFVGLTYSNVGLIAGERLSVRDLLVAALVPSGTEAIYALAEHLGDGSVDEFVEEMNQKADSMGLKNTHFENPAGLDSPGNYSSARDLATIALAAMEHPTFTNIVDSEEATISTQSRHIEVFTTNNLLYTYQEATGIKTGTSPAAGPCLVASATSGDESYIAVVLDAAGEEYRFDAARTLLEYGFNDFDRRALARKGQVYEELSLPYRREESVGLVAATDVPGPAGPGLEVERRVTAKEAPPAAKAGQELGTVEVLVDGKSVGSSPLLAKRRYEEASLWQKIKYWTSGAAKSASGWISDLTSS